MSELLHRNSKGIIMIREDFKKRSRVKVLSERDGHRRHMRTYRFNRIPDRFSSPYCSWANLDCCGGWSFDTGYLDTAVQEGKKLYAGHTIHLKSRYSIDEPTIEEALEQLDLLRGSLPDGVVTGIEYVPRSDGHLNTFICRTGKIEDYFDIEEVLSFYGKLGLEFPKKTIDDVHRFCQFEIPLFASQDAPFLYHQAQSPAQFITTGLLLGYPIESTVSILCGY